MPLSMIFDAWLILAVVSLWAGLVAWLLALMVVTRPWS